MAVYSTFFLSEPEQLPNAFPGWKLPLPKAVTRTVMNPFTGREVTITSKEPDWDDVEFHGEDYDSDEMDYQVVAIEGDYATYLERRIPSFVRSQPHWCGKGLTSVELEPLVTVAEDVAKVTFDTPLYAPPSIIAGIDQIPSSFVAVLKTLDNSSVGALAASWAKKMSTREYTHTTGGKRVHDDWVVEDAISLLMPLVDLAKRETQNQEMYLLYES